MKILLVHISPIIKYPPALAVLQYLDDMGVEVLLCTTDIDSTTKSICEKRNIKVLNIDEKYEGDIGLFNKFLRMYKLKKIVWKEIDKNYDQETVLWIFSDLTLKHLGKKLFKYRYVLHMFELSERTYFYRKFKFLFIKTQEYAQKALCVIQAEYNRAHIAQAWWNLNKTPFIITNKPYNLVNIQKNNKISTIIAERTIEKIKDKKIILYQGIINDERPLENFIKAIDELGEDYAFVVMSGDPNIYQNIESKNFYYIPFIASPLHLEVTSNAYIGILTYVPTNNEYSKLNSLYCAPNKLYEFSMFGIPMIGNDIPGVSYVFNTERCGTCFESFEKDSIIKAINEIEKDYTNIAKNARNFYDKVDVRKQLELIIEDIKGKI